MSKFRFSLLFLAFFLFQCNVAERETEHIDNETDSVEDVPDTTTAETEEPQGNMHVSEFLDMPFTLTVKGDGNWESNTKIKPNVHQPEKKDTLNTLVYNHSEVQLLNGMYLNATIQDEDILLAKQLHVGMSRTEFEKAFDELNPHRGSPYIAMEETKIIMSCCPDLDQNPVWTFGFERDTLQIILFDNYLD